MRGVSPTEPRWLPRKTPWLEPHGTAVAGQYDNRGGDDRFFNNIFAARNNLAWFNTRAALPVIMEGNVFTRDTTPARQEEKPLLAPEFEPRPAIEIRNGEAWLRLAADPAWTAESKRRLVTSAVAGRTATANLPFENPDGSAISIDTDYLGKKRNPQNPFPGPFEPPVIGEVKVWPK
jgi:alpha-N-arabinofuranosidase